MSKSFSSVAIPVLTLFILACPISGGTTSAVCGWSGTAPFCDGKCPSGQTQLPSNSQRCGTGACCSTGSKALCCTLPSCPTGFEWAENEVGVDPCFLASQISEACAPSTQQEVLSSNGNSYSPPTAQEQTICTCSTPLYFLVSACAFCQGGTYVDWKTWSAACTKVVATASGLTASASGIPSSDASSIDVVRYSKSLYSSDLPSWSFSNVMIQPSFNATIAQDVAEGIPVPATSTSTITTTETLSPSQLNEFRDLKRSKATTDGAVGGAIGGTTFLLLTVWLVWCMRTRVRSPERAPNPDMGASYCMPMAPSANERASVLGGVQESSGDGRGPMQHR